MKSLLSALAAAAITLAPITGALAQPAAKTELKVGFVPGPYIDGFKKGAKATMTIVPVAAPDQKVNLDISLKGFTAGYDAVAKTPAP